jgi:hypothetical protein
VREWDFLVGQLFLALNIETVILDFAPMGEEFVREEKKLVADKVRLHGSLGMDLGMDESEPWLHINNQGPLVELVEYVDGRDWEEVFDKENEKFEQTLEEEFNKQIQVAQQQL